MKRDRLLQRVDQGWNMCLQTFEGLPDRVLLESGVVGDWSIRDLMAHAAIWEEEALEALPIILKGKSTVRYARYGGIDTFNELALEKKQRMSLNEVREGMVATHKRLIDFLSSVPETAYATEGRFLKRLRLDTYNHYREHAGQIEAWRKKTRH